MKKIQQYKKELIGGFILVVLAFYGGMKYGQSSAPVTGTPGIRNFSGAMGARGTRGGNFGGVAAGAIVAKDTTSITLGMPDGTGSRIIFFSDATPVSKSVAGTVSDLTVGENISVNGTANSDGSINAQSIQIRPAGFRGAPDGAKK